MPLASQYKIYYLKISIIDLKFGSRLNTTTQRKVICNFLKQRLKLQTIADKK